MKQLRCAHILTAGPRAGEVCNRRYMAPHAACVNHRPEVARPGKRPTPEQDAARKAREKRRRTMAGIPAGWTV